MEGQKILEKTENTEKFSIYVFSRAVANLSSLSEYCLPFVKVGGMFVSYKSGKVQEEASAAERAVKLLGGKMENICCFELAQTDYGKVSGVYKKDSENSGQISQKSRGSRKGTPVRIRTPIKIVRHPGAR